MLIIGQPKSATTSFMWSLSEILGKPHKNGQNRKQNEIECEGFTEIQKYHGTTVKRSKDFLKQYIRNDVVYKEHILPTKEHLEIIKEVNYPVIVLLRNATQTVKSYKRVFEVLPEIENQVDYEEFKNDLKEFQDRYKKEAEKYPEIYKIIYYKDLIKDFTSTIKSAIIHLKLEVPKNIEKFKLQKRNYTYR